MSTTLGLRHDPDSYESGDFFALQNNADRKERGLEKKKWKHYLLIDTIEIEEYNIRFK